MGEDHIQGLLDAYAKDDDDLGRHHVIGLARHVLSLLLRGVLALEKIAARGG